jgi:hypothetical protein
MRDVYQQADRLWRIPQLEWQVNRRDQSEPQSVTCNLRSQMGGSSGSIGWSHDNSVNGEILLRDDCWLGMTPVHFRR